jgi:hypothetical protein
MNSPADKHDSVLILSAALLLATAQQTLAQTTQEPATLSLQYMDYRDEQDGLQRIRAHTPSIALNVPVAEAWSLAATLTADQVSGASPRHHTVISSASHMDDVRHAADASVTHYLENASITAGAAWSNEHDYLSRTLSVQGAVSSADKNTTWHGGVSVTNDVIEPVTHIVNDASRHTLDLLLGLTQVMGPLDIVQLNLDHIHGAGYFSDPYKALDNRPPARSQSSISLRWNHHFPGLAGTLRNGYRYYRDSYGIVAHTLDVEYVQALPSGWQLTPSLRWYTQRAARFYYDPVYDSELGTPFPPGYVIGGQNGYVSGDQRLAGFGARGLGFQVQKQLGPAWTMHVKFESYEQRAGWRWFGQGSPGLAPLRARVVQLGLSTQW